MTSWIQNQLLIALYSKLVHAIPFFTHHFIYTKPPFSFSIMMHWQRHLRGRVVSVGSPITMKHWFKSPVALIERKIIDSGNISGYMWKFMVVGGILLSGWRMESRRYAVAVLLYAATLIAMQVVGHRST